MTNVELFKLEKKKKTTEMLTCTPSFVSPFGSTTGIRNPSKNSGGMA